MSEESSLLRHSFVIPEDEITEVHGIRVCSMERLITDLARLRPARLSIVTIDAACATLTMADKFEREATLERFERLRTDLMDRLARHAGGRGVARAREVLELADPLSESPGESAVRWAIVAFGLPWPISQKEVWTSGGRQYFLDLWIEELGIAIEFDGAGKYEGEAGQTLMWNEKRRDIYLEAEGIRVVHLSWTDIAHFAAVRTSLLDIFGPAVLAAARPRHHLFSEAELSLLSVA